MSDPDPKARYESVQRGATRPSLKLSVFHGEPDFWSGAHGTLPNSAPVYGKVKDRNGNDLDLDQEVIVRFGSGTTPRRAVVVGIGDLGLPDRHVVKVREHKSAYLITVGPEWCEPHEFDEYEWLAAETEAARRLSARDIDLGRATFGGFYFETYQRLAMQHYLAAAGKGAGRG